MTYIVFSGTLNPTQSIYSALHNEMQSPKQRAWMAQKQTRFHDLFSRTT